MAQQLKTKYINVIPGQLFCRQYKTKFLLETDLLHLWSRQSSICYRYWQWINWMSNTEEKAPINWHFTCQLTRIYQNFKEQYFRSIKSTSWLSWTADCWTWMSWLGSTRQCKKNWKRHHIQNQSNFLPWYLINGLECTVQNILISLNTFIWNQKSRWNISKTCS